MVENFTRMAEQTRAGPSDWYHGGVYHTEDQGYIFLVSGFPTTGSAAEGTGGA